LILIVWVKKSSASLKKNKEIENLELNSANEEIKFRFLEKKEVFKEKLKKNIGYDLKLVQEYIEETMTQKKTDPGSGKENLYLDKESQNSKCRGNVNPYDQVCISAGMVSDKTIIDPRKYRDEIDDLKEEKKTIKKEIIYIKFFKLKDHEIKTKKVEMDSKSLEKKNK